ncbi:MAG: sensor histidine kinase [Omnitrophica WOR_2 bacterium]
MKENSFNATLLSVFRLFVGIRLLFSLLTYLLPRFFINPPPPTYNLNLLGIADAALLLVFLSWPWLQGRLGKAYIPLALGIATVGPVVENFLAVDLRIATEVNQFRSAAGQWQLVILLLIPLILVSWRYGFRAVVGYCLSLVILDGALMLMFHFSGGPPYWILMGIVIFRTLLFLLVGYVINRLGTEQRQQNEQLEEANRQLARHAAALEQLATSRERNRMARELHDTLAHSLSAVAVELQAVDALWDTNPPDARQMLKQSIQMTRSGLKEARAAIQSLRLAPLEDLGLSIALGNLANSMAERGGFSLKVQIPNEIPELNLEVEHSIYRISEEALRNIVQHAQAKNVELSLEFNHHHLNLNVQDDGRGFTETPGNHNNHYGIKGMRERAESIGAQLEIDSQPGQGTTVRLGVEMNHD